MNRSRRKDSRGFSLLHMLVAMPLFMVFLYLASRLYITNQKIFTQSAESAERITRIDAAVHQLRIDAWLSSEARVTAESLTLVHRDTERTWRIEPDDGLTRAESSDPQAIKRFNDIAVTAIKKEAGGVTVEIAGELYFFVLGDRPHSAKQGDPQ